MSSRRVQGPLSALNSIWLESLLINSCMLLRLDAINCCNTCCIDCCTRCIPCTLSNTSSCASEHDGCNAPGRDCARFWSIQVQSNQLQCSSCSTLRINGTINLIAGKSGDIVLLDLFQQGIYSGMLLRLQSAAWCQGLHLHVDVSCIIRFC